MLDYIRLRASDATEPTAREPSLIEVSCPRFGSRCGVNHTAIATAGGITPGIDTCECTSRLSAVAACARVICSGLSQLPAMHAV